PAEVHPQAVVALVPGGGSAEIDSGLPVGAQIVYARLRIWNALTRSAGTAADRSAILLDLLSRDQGEFAKVTVLRACMQNWSAEVHPQAVVALVPGGGSAEIDGGLPVGAQIVYARLRIWNALTRSAGTAADRSAILLDLLSRDQGEFAKVTVLRACMQNWSA